MRATQWTTREFRQMLEQNGYCLIREKGSHFLYKNAAGNAIVLNKGINRMVARRLVKKYDLRVMDESMVPKQQTGDGKAGKP